MHDPLERLDQFDPGPPMSPLPPAEIRRRGERFRRRRQAMTVAGAVLAVALVAVPIGVLAQGDERPPPAEPAPSLTEIPEDFPLADGMGDAEVTDSAAMERLDLCGSTPLEDVEPRDVRSARVEGGDTSDTRTLYLLADQDAVRETYEIVLDAASDCSITSAEDPDSADSDVTFRPVSAGWTGVTITKDFARGQVTTEPAVEVIHVVTVGDAVLVTSTFGSWAGDLDTGIADTRDAVSPVVEAMDVFLPPRATHPPDAGSGELTEEALLTESEVPDRERLTDWLTFELAAQPVLQCAPGPLDDLGAEASVRRDFVAGIDGSPVPPDDSVPPPASAQTAVLQFGTGSQAEAAYDVVKGWLRECPGLGEEADPAFGPRLLELEAPAVWWSRVVSAPEYCGDTDCDAAKFDRAGVALVGERVVIVSLRELGGPGDPPGLDETMDQLFSAAIVKAERGVTDVPVEREGDGQALGIADVPVDWDLADLTGDGGEILGPDPDAPGAGEVSPCDRDAWPVAGVERLAVTTTGPEFSESREVVDLGSADEAVAAMQVVRGALEACPTEVNPDDPTANPEQLWTVHDDLDSQDSVIFSVTYADGMPGGMFWQLTRVGSAIVAVSTGGEYSRRSTSYAVGRLTDITAHLTPAMCAYTEDGC